MFMSAALVFWFGVKRIVESQSNPGNVVAVSVVFKCAGNRTLQYRN